MKNTSLAVALLALPNIVGAFTTAGGAWSTSTAPSVVTSSFRLMSYSAPGGGWDDSSNAGGWDNDDYLNSLGGGTGNGETYGGGYYCDQQQQQQQEEGGQYRVGPENDMTDEEITMMAMRAAQYYNTDASIEEVYGVPRQQGSTPRMDEGEFQ